MLKEGVMYNFVLSLTLNKNKTIIFINKQVDLFFQ